MRQRDALLVISIAVSAAAGGWMWLLAAVMVPLLEGWAFLQRMMAAGRGQQQLTRPLDHGRDRVGDRLSVALFCAVVAYAFQH